MLDTILNEERVSISYQGSLLAGVDEVGRGPLLGPVVAAAVILPQTYKLIGLTDSKKLTPEKRIKLAEEIKEIAICFAIGRAEASEIDKLNILQASLLAMQRAVMGLAIKPEFIVIDGKQVPKLDYPMQAIIKGDLLVPCISAASIIAKVSRDEEMQALDKLYPQYGIKDHKGYATKRHLQALSHYGPIKEHRLSFAPVKDAMEKQMAV